MSSNRASSSATYSSSSYSFSSSSNSSSTNGHTSGQRSMQQTYTDPQGNTTVQSASQNLGQPIVQDTRSYDAQGRELLGGGSGAGGSANRRIEDVSEEEQAQRDREYEERIEEEYAKREGGA